MPRPAKATLSDAEWEACEAEWRANVGASELARKYGVPRQTIQSRFAAAPVKAGRKVQSVKPIAKVKPPPETEKTLTAKQEMFVAEYLVDLNATQAAIRAGYPEKTARQMGSENLSKPDIAEAIEKAFKARSKRVNLNADYVLNNLVEISERCLQRAPVQKFDREEGRIVQVVDEDGNNIWTFDATGATKANELLGKHLKIFTEKVEHSGDALMVNIGRFDAKP